MLPARTIRSLHLDIGGVQARGRCGMSRECCEGRLPTSLARGVWHVLRGSRGAPTNLDSSTRRFVHTNTRRARRRRATGSRRPDCPRRVGVANQSDTHSRVVPTGRDWHSSQRPRIRQVGNGSTRNFIANTRAPPSLRRARCSRTSTFVIVPRRAA